MQISQTVQVAASAQRVWELVSDLPGMGRLSPENAGGTWLGDATGPAVGAQLKGVNRAGRRRWSTLTTVVRCEPGSAFAFDVTALGLKVARWEYAIEPEGAGCAVTETWTDHRGPVMVAIGRLTTGVADREAFTERSIASTLAALTTAAQA